MESIPLFTTVLGSEEINSVIETMKSGNIGTGNKTELFESDFAKYIGVKHAIGMDSCTNSLHLALRGLGIGPGDEVITTPLTFVATVNSILYTGAIPVFADIDPNTLNISPLSIEKKITSKTKAILPVHIYGNPCDMDEILEIAKLNKLKIVSDCAHAIEAEYKGQKVGNLGDAACFSFYATKNLTTGNGGMLVTNDKNLAEYCRIVRDHGMAAGAWSRYQTGEMQHFEMVELGYKCIMWDVQASIGFNQLKLLEERNIKRQQIAQRYEAAFCENKNIELLERDKNNKHAFHMYVIKLLNLDRDLIATEIEKKGVSVGVHYRPVHLEPYYANKFPDNIGKFPIAEEMGEKILTLPIWPELSPELQQHVIDVLQEVL